MKWYAVACSCFLSLMCLLGCGLEEFYFIDYIPRINYDDLRAVIMLPSPSSDNGYGAPNDYFDNFIIFYRIYISDHPENTGRELEDPSASSLRTAISSAFNSDYNTLYSYTDITRTDVNTSGLESSLFCYSRKYFLLTLEGANINSVLDSSSLGQRVEIMFSTNPGEEPTLAFLKNDGTRDREYNLRRAESNENFNPPLFNLDLRPDSRFLNSSDLLDTSNITNERNADVATNTASGLHYSYVSMYIAARGRNREPLPRTIYSQPTFIGIFRLADR